MTLDEYEVGLLFSLAQAHKKETGGGEGVVIVKNEPYENFPLLHGKYSKGQYTYKIYHEESKMPEFIRLVAPPEALIAHEESWNAYPYGKIIYSNPQYMKGNCWMEIDTFHAEDRGESENVHELNSEELESRSVIHIDIANDPVDEKDYVEESDPTKFKSKMTGRGPLTGDWMVSTEPVMTAYIIVKIFLNWYFALIRRDFFRFSVIYLTLLRILAKLNQCFIFFFQCFSFFTVFCLKEFN